ncbi:MAG: hypothetical protein AAFY41_15845 [Bacteroidota bacterium]
MTVVFHVGFPKAASTTLQKSLFAKHSEIVNLGIYPTGNIGKDSKDTEPTNAPILQDSRIKSLYQSLTNEDGVLFDGSATKQLLHTLVDEYKIDDSTIIFSSESVLSGRFSNPEIIEKARRTQVICPQAKILIVIRSQVDMLKALYRDHPFDPRTLAYRPRPVSFSEWLKIQLELPYLSLTNTLLFSKVVERYEQLFPEEQILVLPLELLKEQPQVFVKDLANFLDIDSAETALLLKSKPENQGISALGNQYRRWRSRLMPYAKILKPARSLLASVDEKLFSAFRALGKTERIVISESDRLLLYKKYVEDNTSLAERRNLPLARLGYLTSELDN